MYKNSFCILLQKIEMHVKFKLWKGEIKISNLQAAAHYVA